MIYYFSKENTIYFLIKALSVSFFISNLLFISFIILLYKKTNLFPDIPPKYFREKKDFIIILSFLT